MKILLRYIQSSMLTNLFETNGHWAPLERCIFIVLCIISTICRTFCGVINSLLHLCACTALWLWCLAPTLSFWRPKLMPFIPIYTNSRYLPMRLFLFCVMRFGQGGWGGGGGEVGKLPITLHRETHCKARQRKNNLPPSWLGGGSDHIYFPTYIRCCNLPEDGTKI